MPGFRWIVFLLCAGTPSIAAAIVNIEGVRGEEQAEGQSAVLSLSVDGASGNTDKHNLALGARLQRNQGRHRDLLLLDYHYGERDRSRDTNKTFAHLRHTIQARPRRASEVFLQAERNEFTRLSLRTLIGAGLRYSLATGGRWQSHLGVGAYYAREELEPRPGLTDHGVDTRWRANTYLALKVRLNDHTHMGSTTYYQPDPRATDDFRLLEQAVVQSRLSERLDLKFSVYVAHDSRPPQSIEKTDISYLSGLELRF